MNHKGSLHLAALLMIVVALAVAGIGVKVYRAGHAHGLANKSISISSPASESIVSDFVPIAATVDTKQQISKVSFLVDGSVVPDVGAAKCSAKSARQSAQYNICWDSRSVADGKHNLFVQITLEDGSSLTGGPVIFSIKNSDALIARIHLPAAGSTVKPGYISVSGQSSAPAALSFAVNGAPMPTVDIGKCYSARGRAQPPNSQTVCFNSLDAAFSGLSKFTFIVTAKTADGRTVSSAPSEITTYLVVPEL